jgi:SAM-dependent methyltransferase
MIHPRCRLCDREVYQQVRAKQKCGDIADWMICQCGALSHQFKVEKTPFNLEYVEHLKRYKMAEERYGYFVRTYAPLIEELTYGRKMLEVGFGVPYIMKAFESRGWIIDGIDIIPNEFTTGDFESFDFLNEGKDRYDLIWMGDVLQCLNDPMAALIKAYNLLNPNGLLFICTPNAGLLQSQPMPHFGHWNAEENKIIISSAILMEMLGRVDESMTGRCRVVFMNDEIVGHRFITWNSMHVIAQKRKIESMTMPEMVEDEKSIKCQTAEV